ncbi:dethiobiotin synthase [Kyrpidia spormannii]|uniref:ATP-dependent dethiobiotin synthetase BioD n=2 Tax=Kyrpidia spormannii TaxID=2055160 RepID=A0ACA8ZCR7_9BACL|nr:dethiobiotin synthase [Kyrpidia spormannii]CAB3394297.1 ATP-dependent dethiobiotin synthetase BioD [Kyrpidia spormannii]CAB3395233.1 ATP-dependent dethiobiotin synthetase BioD [Kyrpidia spormannii]
MSGAVVIGTDTEVGKTWITGALVGLYREVGLRATTWKPVQSGCRPGDPGSDSARLKWLGGLEEEESSICPYTLAEPLAPALAARRAGVALDPEKWREILNVRLQRHDLVLVEGAGGITVPLADGFTAVELAKGADLPVLIVARAGLGTVNHILLTVAYARQAGLRVAGVILNGGGRDGGTVAEQTNPELIREYSDVPILGRVPWLPGRPGREEILGTVKAHVDLEAILQSIRGGDR